MIVRNLLFSGLFLLAGCASPVFRPEGAAVGLTPDDAVAQFARAEGRRVIWGGVVVESRNLAESTELVVLGFPLSRSQRPQARSKPVGRFIVRYPGYLETAVYEPDRLVTVDATVVGLDTRPVGEARYRYPVARADAVHLWPEDERSESRVRLGIGIGIHN